MAKKVKPSVTSRAAAPVRPAVKPAVDTKAKIAETLASRPAARNTAPQSSRPAPIAREPERAPPPSRNAVTQRPSSALVRDLGTPEIDDGFGGAEHRHFPRARLEVRFDIWIGEGDQRRFSASLSSRNISVSGVFVESTFFLPIDTEVQVSFRLDQQSEPVRARAVIVREERPNARTGEGRSGMGLHFVEFYDQSQVTLARLFLGEQLRAFAREYLQSKRAATMGSERDRLVDALAAWELSKTMREGDPWRPNKQG